MISYERRGGNRASVHIHIHFVLSVCLLQHLACSRASHWDFVSYSQSRISSVGIFGGPLADTFDEVDMGRPYPGINLHVQMVVML